MLRAPDIYKAHSTNTPAAWIKPQMKVDPFPASLGKLGKQGKQDQCDEWCGDNRDSAVCLQWTGMGAKGEIQLLVCGMPQCSIMQLILTATVEWKMVGGEEVRLSLCFPQQTYGLLHLIQFSKPENSVDPTALKGWSYDPNHSQLTPMKSTAHRVFISFWLFDCRLFVASLLCVFGFGPKWNFVS